MSVSDRAKRKRAAEETRTKLRSPNFCVSTTRLNVRNVPRSWDEKKLKQLVIAAVKERATKAQPKVVQVKILREGAVGQEKDKDAPPGRSKGIAFVEFSEHEHALCALRQLNNNPKPWGKEHRPIVEFAIDNVKALKVREARQARSLTGGEKPEAGVPEATQGAGKGGGKAAKTAKGAEEAEVEDGGDEQPKSKRKLRQERRNMLKQRKRQEQGKKEEQREEGGGGAAKSRRRREQRKRKKEGGGVDAGAEDGVVSVAPAGKKVRKEAAPPATSAAAVPSRARAAAAEEKARGRKRQADAVVDMAASAGMAAGGKVLRKRKDKGDRLDVLVDKYKAKLDSSDGGARKGGKVVASLAAPAAKKEPSKRWFE